MAASHVFDATESSCITGQTGEVCEELVLGALLALLAVHSQLE